MEFTPLPPTPEKPQGGWQGDVDFGNTTFPAPFAPFPKYTLAVHLELLQSFFLYGKLHACGATLVQGHANLLCTLPVLAHVLPGERGCSSLQRSLTTATKSVAFNVLFLEKRGARLSPNSHRGQTISAEHLFPELSRKASSHPSEDSHNHGFLGEQTSFPVLKRCAFPGGPVPRGPPEGTPRTVASGRKKDNLVTTLCRCVTNTVMVVFPFPSLSQFHPQLFYSSAKKTNKTPTPSFLLSLSCPPVLT